MISKALLQAFKKLRPDLLEVEFTEQMCITVLEQIEKRQENDKGKMTDKEMRLTVRVNLLQEELRLALLAGEDIKALKEKATHIMGQFTKQRESAQSADSRRQTSEKRTDMLVAHIEKLMKCLKMEAASKIKLAEANRRERMLCFQITKKLDEKDRSIAHRNKLIAELKEGAYVLEGQLRLMDERFYELRMKLDAARSNQKHYVEKAQKTAKELRKKFAVIHGPRHNLDDVVVPELPPIQDENNYNYSHNSNSWQQNAYNTEFNDVAGTNRGEEGFAEGSVADAGGVGTGDFNAPPGKIRPGTAAARRLQQTANPQEAATDPHSQLRENIQLRSSTRPRTAPHARSKTAGARSTSGASTAKKGGAVYGFQPSGNDDADVDRIITRIYNKHANQKGMRWTPDALADLVRGDSGKVHCPIPDLRPKQTPQTITL